MLFSPRICHYCTQSAPPNSLIVNEYCRSGRFAAKKNLGYRNGFHKNNSMEKQPESEEDLLEHRTDGTDAFDTLYIGCEKFPQHDIYPVTLGGIV